MLGKALIQAASGNAVIPPKIGDPYEGGYFAGQIQVSGTIYNLVVAPKSSGESSAIQYKTSNISDTNPNSQNEEYGKLATDQFNDSAHPAFQWASGLSIDGYTDWYIPAKNELEIIYRNLKPTTTANDTTSGANSNAVPSATANYTSGDPTQTSVVIFQTGQSQAFDSALYWSSSENSLDVTNAWAQNFNTGLQNSVNKASDRRARAIRRVIAPV